MLFLRFIEQRHVQQLLERHSNLSTVYFGRASLIFQWFLKYIPTRVPEKFYILVSGLWSVEALCCSHVLKLFSKCLVPKLSQMLEDKVLFECLTWCTSAPPCPSTVQHLQVVAQLFHDNWVATLLSPEQCWSLIEVQPKSCGNCMMEKRNLFFLPK